MMIAEEEVIARIAATIRRVLKIADSETVFTRETTALDVQGWDSLSHALVIMAVEREFSVELPIEETLDMANIGDLVDAISRLKS